MRAAKLAIAEQSRRASGVLSRGMEAAAEAERELQRSRRLIIGPLSINPSLRLNVRGPILIVEDFDGDYLCAEQVLLCLDGSQRVARSNTLPAAMLWVDTYVPSLILLDLSLAGACGLDLIAHARKNVALDSVPIIVWTGLVTEEVRGQALRLGADEVLEKQFHPDEQMKDFRRMLARWP